MKLNNALTILNAAVDEIEEKYCDIYEDDEISEEYLEGALDGVQSYHEVIMALLQELSEVKL